MNRLSIAAIIAVLWSPPLSAAPRISLPDNETYYYWFRSTEGTVQHAPRISSGTGVIDLAGHIADTQAVFILDPHTGGVAEFPIGPGPVKGGAVSIDQFQLPGGPPVSASPSPAIPAAVALPAAAEPKPSERPSLVSGIVTTTLGLAVFGLALWFIRRLVTTRGQLLIDAARKVGIDVPDPDQLPPTAIETDGIYTPPPLIKVQRVPDEAFRPIAAKAAGGYLTTEEGSSYGIVDRALSIGRGQENDIVLLDTSVSRRHARIEPMGEAAEIIDEGSANGIFVNGERVVRQVLSPGDHLHIGRIPLRYEK